jgi:hypothetical protein
MHGPGSGPKFESGESSVIARIRFSIDAANNALAGRRIFTDTICDDLRRYLDEAKEGHIALNQLRDDAEKMLKLLPAVEIRNCLAMTKKLIDSGDLLAARSWRGGTETRLINSTEKETISPTQAHDFRVQLDSISKVILGD